VAAARVDVEGAGVDAVIVGRRDRHWGAEIDPLLLLLLLLWLLVVGRCGRNAAEEEGSDPAPARARAPIDACICPPLGSLRGASSGRPLGE